MPEEQVPDKESDVIEKQQGPKRIVVHLEVQRVGRSYPARFELVPQGKASQHVSGMMIILFQNE